MKKHKFLKTLIIALMCIVALPSNATQRPSDSEAQTSIRQPKTNMQVTLSFTLFQQLMYKTTNEVIQYLKQRGCKIENSGESYSTNVRGGTILIYPKSVSFPRAGKGPVEFCTEDANVRDAWYRGLRKNDYTPCGEDEWCGDNGHKPTFRVIDYIGVDIEADYAGVCTLCVQSFPMKYNPAKGCYE